MVNFKSDRLINEILRVKKGRNFLEKSDFFAKYKINEAEFKNSKLIWDNLLDIYSDFKGKIKQYESAGKMITEDLRDEPKVHSIKYRVKDPEHLIEKIIRKSIEFPDREITIKNYQLEITDLLGVRALHLFKADWIFIHKYILNQWKINEVLL
jgi:putative GTP pyrophosphokinase